ncbi:hypothetical protein QE152_g34800 [Popillia japonica]|uniref:Uncharacterized protein n=1 Tax=Popillia japonica TaxID=7064 RepID=A0AAW1ITG1_POPJA
MKGIARERWKENRRQGGEEGGDAQRDAQITSRTNAGGNARRIEMRVLAARTSRRSILNSEEGQDETRENG